MCQALTPTQKCGIIYNYYKIFAGLKRISHSIARAYVHIRTAYGKMWQEWCPENKSQALPRKRKPEVVESTPALRQRPYNRYWRGFRYASPE